MSGKAMAYLDGAIAGLIEASIAAVTFLFIDTVTQRPLYTPTLNNPRCRRAARYAVMVQAQQQQQRGRSFALVIWATCSFTI